MAKPYIGPHIRKLRDDKGWSLKDLAQRSGLNIETVNRAELGGNNNIATIEKIASAFDLTFPELTAAAYGLRTAEPEPKIDVLDDTELHRLLQKILDADGDFRVGIQINLQGIEKLVNEDAEVKRQESSKKVEKSEGSTEVARR